MMIPAHGEVLAAQARWAGLTKIPDHLLDIGEMGAPIWRLPTGDPEMGPEYAQEAWTLLGILTQWRAIKARQPRATSLEADDAFWMTARAQVTRLSLEFTGRMARAMR